MKSEDAESRNQPPKRGKSTLGNIPKRSGSRKKDLFDSAENEKGGEIVFGKGKIVMRSAKKKCREKSSFKRAGRESGTLL